MDNRTIRLSDAIKALEAEKVHGDDPTDVSYDIALDHAIAALSALPAVEGHYTQEQKRNAVAVLRARYSEGSFSKHKSVSVKPGEFVDLVCSAMGLTPLPAPPIE